MEILKKFSSKELRKMAFDTISPVFTSQGFKKSDYNFRKEYRDGVFGFIGFGASSGGIYNTLFLNLHIGLEQINAFQLVRKLIESPNKTMGCNAWQGLYNIVPETDYFDYEWEIQNQSDAEKVRDILSSLLFQVIEPYFKENCCMSMYKYNIIQGNYGIEMFKNIYTPVIYYLEGDKNKGLEYINNKIMTNPGKAYQDPLEKTFLKNYQMLP